MKIRRLLFLALVLVPGCTGNFCDLTTKSNELEMDGSVTIARSTGFFAGMDITGLVAFPLDTFGHIDSTTLDTTLPYYVEVGDTNEEVEVDLTWLDDLLVGEDVDFRHAKQVVAAGTSHAATVTSGLDVTATAQGTITIASDPSSPLTLEIDVSLATSPPSELDFTQRFVAGTTSSTENQCE